MLRTAVIDTEYKKNGEIRLDNITSLKVFNAGNTIAVIAGFPVYPNQKEVIIPADNTISNIILELEFKSLPSDEPIKKQIASPVSASKETRFEPIDEPIKEVNYPPVVKDQLNKIVVIYKHII